MPVKREATTCLIDHKIFRQKHLWMYSKVFQLPKKQTDDNTATMNLHAFNMSENVTVHNSDNIHGCQIKMSCFYIVLI